MSSAGQIKTILGERLKTGFPLAPLTTLGIGGPADYFAGINNEAELEAVMRWAREKKISAMAIGFGSNLLIGDKGVRGLVVRLAGDFLKLEIQKGGILFAGAAVRLPKMVTFAAEKGFAGMESLVGVPGTIGGGIYMNAGTREGEISEHLKTVRFLELASLHFKRLDKEKIKFSYRRSFFHATPAVILSGIFKFPLAKSREDVLNTIRGFIRRRKQTQPVDTKNAGSMFTNPEGDTAARLIEAAGWKGKKVGDAQVSTLHANFIVNIGRARAADVRELMSKIRQSVREKFSVELNPEVRFVGEF